MKSFFTTIFIILFAVTGNLMAQSGNFVLLDKSTMQVDGTSTIHDWTVDAEEINLDAEFNTSAITGDSFDQQFVPSLTLNVPAKKLESGKGKMNRKMNDALKVDDHPNITFKLSSTELAENNSSSFKLNATGDLTIAGVTKEVSLPVEGSMQDDGTYKFTGSYELNMEDYNVDPPSAMFGTIKSGENVTISFEFYVTEG